MKNNIIKIGTAIALLAVITFASCKKNDPKPNNQNEEYDAIKISFIKLDTNGSETTDTITVGFNASGVASPSNLDLDSHQQYRMLINLFASGENINQEIIDDAAEHKFFFFANPSTGVGSYVYNDGIGLDGKIEIDGHTTFNLQVLLRHGLDKTHPDAQAYNSPNYQNAGGNNDLNVNFNITPGH